MRKDKVVWCSRHKMTAEQKADFTGKEIICKNIVWQATDDCLADIKVNKAIWTELRATAQTIAGVFPPVAIEVMTRSRWHSIISPVSRQNKTTRKDGSVKIDFVHVRWVNL